MAAAYGTTVHRLTRRMIDGQCCADRVYAMRTRRRIHKALLEICVNEAQAVVMAESVGRLSRLGALQPFQ